MLSREMEVGMYRYAAHRLRLGDYVVERPLIELRGKVLQRVSLFDKEIERTIFVGGTIVLEIEDYPSSPHLSDGDCPVLSLEELEMRLATYYDKVRVSLPEEEI